MLYWRDISGNTIAEMDATFSTTNSNYNEYIFFAGRRIAQSNPSSGNVYYYFADHLGSNRVVTTATGTACYEVDYLPYGAENTPSGFSDTCSTRYRFTGYERDLETAYGTSAGNDYAFARYYNSRLGRFMSGDPLDGDTTDPQTLNHYAYVRDNPINLIDPSGMDTCPPDTPTSVCVNVPSPDPAPTGPGGDGPGVGGAPGTLSSCLNAYGCGTSAPRTCVARALADGGNAAACAGGHVTPPQTPGQPPLSPKAQVCQEKVQNAVNAALNTSAQFQGSLMDRRADSEGLIHGAYNFNFFAPGSNLTSLAATNCGRFSSNLHIIIPIQGCNVANDPFVFNVTPGGTYFTAHIDSADPVDLAGLLTHFFRDYVANRVFGYNHGC